MALSAFKIPCHALSEPCDLDAQGRPCSKPKAGTSLSFDWAYYHNICLAHTRVIHAASQVRLISSGKILGE